MVAQKGTLNFFDGSGYLVLSLPASAFAFADEDKDLKLSPQEFSSHRKELMQNVQQQVQLHRDDEVLELQGLMLSPVAPHGAPAEPASQLVVMGRFVVGAGLKKLRLFVELYGEAEQEKSFEVTAKHKASNQQQVLLLTEKKPEAALEFE